VVISILLLNDSFLISSVGYMGSIFKFGVAVFSDTDGELEGAVIHTD
jgi:hypothetical protein